MELKGSRSERNVLMAFAGESQARNRYTFFSSQARNDGYIQIASIFEETANQEKEHAKRFFKFLQGGEVKIELAFPAGIVGTTAENLLAAAGGEHEEWSVLYPGFAAIAREEGFRRSPSPSSGFPWPSGSTSGVTAVCWKISRTVVFSSGAQSGEVAMPQLRLCPRRP